MSFPPLEGISTFQSVSASLADVYNYTASIGVPATSSSLWASFYNVDDVTAIQQIKADGSDHFFEFGTKVNGHISAFFIPIKRVIE